MRNIGEFDHRFIDLHIRERKYHFKQDEILIKRNQITDFGDYEDPLVFFGGLKREGNRVFCNINQYTDEQARNALKFHTRDLNIHFRIKDIAHKDIKDSGKYTHEVIDDHIDNIENPHKITAIQLGLLDFTKFAGKANGLATLDDRGKIPLDQIPDQLLRPPAVMGGGGSIVTSVNGQIGDVILDVSGLVDSVNGKTGDVILDTDDIPEGSTNLYFTNSRAQAALFSHTSDSSIHFTESSIDHTKIQNRGSNSHAAIDTHIADTTIHFAVGSIDHGLLEPTSLLDDDHEQYVLRQPTANTNINLSGGDFDFNFAAVEQTNALFIQGSDGFVGIGTNTPKIDLDIGGRVMLGTVSGNSDNLWLGNITPIGTNFAVSRFSNDLILNAFSGGTLRYRINNADTAIMNAAGFAVGNALSFLVGGVPRDRFHIQGINVNPAFRLERFQATLNVGDELGAMKFVREAAGFGTSTSYGIRAKIHAEVLTDGGATDLVFSTSVNGGGASNSDVTAEVFRVNSDLTSSFKKGILVNTLESDSDTIISADGITNALTIQGNDGFTGHNNGTPGAWIDTTIASAAQIGQITKAAVSQSANIAEWQISDTTVRAHVTATGEFSDNRNDNVTAFPCEQFGAGASVLGTGNTGFGHDVSIGSAVYWGVAVGYAASVTGNSGIAIGKGATAAAGAVVIATDGVGANNTVVIGDGASATQLSATAVGDHAKSDAGVYGTAFGSSCEAGYGGIAIGHNADNSAHAGSICIGTFDVPSTAGNQLIIGSGAFRVDDIYIGKGVTHATPLATKYNATGGSGTDIIGGDITIAGGKGTGAGVGGSVLFQTSAVLGSGATLQTLVTRMSIDNGGNISVNETEVDADFNISADSITNAFKVQGSDGFSGFNTGIPRTQIDVIGNATIDGDIILPKTSGKGIKVDTTVPTFGFKDIIGDQFSKNTGATKPTLAPYNGAIKSWQFGVGDEAYISYHIPHDYVAGTPIFLHIHWSHILTTVTGGTLTFKATSISAKAHDQQAFNSTPKVGTFIGTASTVQYQQILSEVQYSDDTPTGLEIDTADLEPDSVIELTLEVDANNITVSSGGVPDPFIHYVDIHYQSTNIGTKDKVPNFYT